MNNIHNKDRIEKSVEFLEIFQFLEKILSTSGVYMFWGDIGVGKTTLALQIANRALSSKNKIFYLSTKQTSINLILTRILDKEYNEPLGNFISWEASSFNRQEIIVFDWLMQIQQINEFFKRKRVEVIIVDDIASLYLLSLGKDKVNETLNQKFTLVLATLKKISDTYRIPIILLNSFSVKKVGDEEEQAIPYGGKILDYWVDCEIKIERTRQISRFYFNVEKNNLNLAFPKKWSWILSEKGFS